MNFKVLLLMVLFTLLLNGCSQADKVVTPGGSDGELSRTYIRPPQLDSWNWGNWVFQVNVDHDSIEVVPIREANLHYNVLKFVEGEPCPDCLTIGAGQPQGDGTFMVDVTLRHPFPGHPEYTGFDVKGTVVFPATHYWKDILFPIADFEYGQPSGYYDHIPLYFSRAYAGGGEVLNADGYSFYFFPGFPTGISIPDVPAHQYQEGKYATGTEDELDSTVNPYIEFHNVDERRMFTHDGEVTRTYHIRPPEGEFKFGYIVDASWEPPLNIPVTDPAVDFPDWANAEEGYFLELEQVAPINPDPEGWLEYVLECTLHHRIGAVIYWVHVVTPEFTPGAPWYPRIQYDHMMFFGSKEEIDPWNTFLKLQLLPIDPETEPGYYSAIVLSGIHIHNNSSNAGRAFFWFSPTFQFFDIYVE